MVAQYYRDPDTGEFVLIPGADSQDEVSIQASDPADPDIKLWVDTDDDTGQTGGVPIGSIIAYGGSTAPIGWHLCDGSAHGSPALASVLGGLLTPDLRDRFVVGAGPTRPRMSTGGAASHSHPLSDLGQAAVRLTASTLITRRITSAAWTAVAAVTTAASAGNVTSNTEGASLTGKTDDSSSLPPYYALTYIIKKA